MKKALVLLIKILILTSLFSLLYFLLILKPKAIRKADLAKANLVLSLHKTKLTQNKLAYTQLVKLDPGSLNFDKDRSTLTLALKNSNKEGLQFLENENKLPGVNKKLSERFPILILETKSFYEEQKLLFDKIFQTRSFSEGLEILKSEKAVELLTKQTNLILEFEYYIDKLKT